MSAFDAHEITAAARVLTKRDAFSRGQFALAEEMLAAADRVVPLLQPPSEEIRERTARALYDLLSERNGRAPKWEKHNEHFQNQWRARADVFLAAIGVTA